jgi:serine/threonine protein kinase/ABC-type branched-subunit amino acid transport system substrate-binding protein
MTGDCASEDEMLEFVEGRTSDEARSRIVRHVDTCSACATLIAELAREASTGGARREPESGAAAKKSALVAPGDAVGRYVVRRLLGAGGMGAVYEAHDPQLDRAVAVKLLRPNVGGKDLDARLLREAKAMAKLWHPEVIAVLDAGRHGEQLFIAMELVKGGTMRSWQRAAARPWREIVAMYLRAGRGLAQAHGAGIVHRDFKPDNVLVGDDGRVRVTDFGLARDIDAIEPTAEEAPAADDEDASPVATSLTRTGMILGTPAYMAPEQVGGQGVDVRSDVFSYCVALYEALYGELPFRGATIEELQRAKAAGVIAPPKSDRGVPDRVRRALLVGLRARPEERYASMQKLLDALTRATRRSRAPFVAIAAAAVAIAAIVPALRATRTSAPAAPSASARVAAECASNVGCLGAHGGEPWICRAGACVKIASEDCTPMFEAKDLERDDTVWIGAMFPTKGSLANVIATDGIAGTDFARREIASATASLGARRVALVACDDSVDANRAARHLADDLGVPAVLGFASGAEAIDIATNVLVPRRALAVVTLTSNPLVTRVPQPPGARLVWRTTFDNDQVADATAHFLSDYLEPKLTVRGKTRVALAHMDNPLGAGFAESFYRDLAFNGKPAIDNGADYRELRFPAGDAPPDSLAAAAKSIVEHAPSFVVLAGANESTTVIAEKVERAWPAATPRPTYVVASAPVGRFSAFIGASAERRRRVFSIESLSNSMPNARFVLRYNQAHPDHPVSRTLNPGPSYDAFYLLALAAIAAREKPETGAALADAFPRLLPPGEAIEVGPANVYQALSRLLGGGAIDLQGTQSALDLDRATGECPSDFALLCAAVDRGGRANGEDVESGVVFRSATRKVEGVASCP